MSAPLTQLADTQPYPLPPDGDPNNPDTNNALHFPYIYSCAYGEKRSRLRERYSDVDMDLRFRQITYICTSRLDEAQRFMDGSSPDDRREWLVVLDDMLAFFEHRRIDGKSATRRLKTCVEVIMDHRGQASEGRVQLAKCWDLKPVEGVRWPGEGDGEASGGARERGSGGLREERGSGGFGEEGGERGSGGLFG